MTILSFLISFAYVFVKVLQQKNVINNRYGLMIPVSLLMAMFDYFLIHSIVENNFTIVISIGIGGGLSAILATFLYKKYGEKNK